MRPLRPCLDCGLRTRATTSRCGPCQRARDRRRNRDPQRRALYGGSWTALSREARRRQPWCSLCGQTWDLTLDHEHGQVECRSCNSKHQRR